MEHQQLTDSSSCVELPSARDLGLNEPVAAAAPILAAAASGSARRRWLERLGADFAGRSFALDLNFDHGGPWAGLRQLFAELLPEIEAELPELVERHASELAYVLPALKHELGVRNQTLTDLAPAEEKVRNYPADRAFRIVHGLIDLLDAYKTSRDPDRPWLITGDAFDRIGHIGRRFFAELVRRRATRLDLRLVLAVSPAAELPDLELATGIARRVSVELPAGDSTGLDPAAALAAARELEERVGQDKDRIEVHVAELLRLYRIAGEEADLFRWRCWALETYNSLGFYEDALEYGYAAWSELDRHGTPSHDLRWSMLVKMFMSNVGLQRGEEAYRLVEESGILDDPELERSRRAQLYYLISMLYVRYFKPRDLERGEEYLARGLDDLDAERARMKPEDYHFHRVFNRNGLALVRHFQGRYDEAIALCREGFEQLEKHLAGDQHRLHRSVLLYNIGQVYSALQDDERAVEYYSAALAMDPTYSEYYNDRGSLYLRLGRYREAIADYRRAIELSPPYQEVWTNLGQCHRSLGDMQAALAAYSRALDLDADSLLAWIGRGQAHEAQGRLDEALADYDRALEIEPDQWDTLASRAVVLYQLGEIARSLADLDRAIELAPDEPQLHHNRSIALAELGRAEEAARDLRSYLDLAPDADDREEVEQRLSELVASRAAAAGSSAAGATG